MKVQARAIAEAFDNKTGFHYWPGWTGEIDSDGPLATLKTPTGRFIFVFDREATAKGEASQEKKIDAPIDASQFAYKCDEPACGKEFTSDKALMMHKMHHRKEQSQGAQA